MKHLILTTAAVVLLFSPLFVQAQDAAPNVAVTSVSSMDATGWRSFWKPRFEDKMKQVETGVCDVLFLGDSITNFWEGAGRDVFKKYFEGKKVINMGFSGDRTEHTLWILKEGQVLEKISPKLIVLMIGTNNVGHNSSNPQQTIAGITEILRVLKEKEPQAKILLFAVFPRGENGQDGLRQKVNEINAGLPALADGKTVVFVDINKQLLEPDGDTLSRSMAPDLLHPGAKGYEIWANAILPYMPK